MLQQNSVNYTLLVIPNASPSPCLPRSISRIEALPMKTQQDQDINYRLCSIPPSERCVSCYTNFARHSGDHRIVGATMHMKTLGQTPAASKEVSACKLAVTKGPRPTSRPHYEMPSDDCRMPMSCIHEFPERDDFPFYHVSARQPKVSEWLHSEDRGPRLVGQRTNYFETRLVRLITARVLIKAAYQSAFILNVCFVFLVVDLA